MEFRCYVGTNEGEVVELQRAATDEGYLRRELEREGYAVLSIERAAPRFHLATPQWRFWASRRIPPRQLLQFNQELAALLRAGLPLLQSLGLLLERARDPALLEVLTAVRERVRSGWELSDAFAEHGDRLPPLYPATLKAGERTGELEQVIRRFVRYLKLRLEVRRKVVSALVYPAFLVGASAVLAGIMALYVVPNFQTFFEAANVELPALTQATLAVTATLRKHFLWFLIGVMAAFYALRRWKATPLGRAALDRWKLELPLVGPVIHQFAISEFCRSLALLLSGGLPLVPALEIAVRAIGNRFLFSRLEPVIARVTEGGSLYTALEATHAFEPFAIDMVQVGETTGALDSMLNNVADFLDEEVETRTQRLLQLLEPTLLVLMAFLVGVLLLSVYLPMFSALGRFSG